LCARGGNTIDRQKDNLQVAVNEVPMAKNLSVRDQHEETTGTEGNGEYSEMSRTHGEMRT